MSDPFDPSRYPTWLLVSLVVVGSLLFGVSYLVQVRIVLVSPNYGDVTGIVQLLWRAVLGITTIGSFGIAVYNLRFGDDDGVEGPATNVVIRGENNEIGTLNVYPEAGEDMDDDGAGTVELTDETSTTDGESSEHRSVTDEDDQQRQGDSETDNQADN